MSALIPSVDSNHHQNQTDEDNFSGYGGYSSLLRWRCTYRRPHSSSIAEHLRVPIQIQATPGFPSNRCM
ncbi:hypothetical protein S83_045863 [Arachis hypogaea]